MTKLPKRFPEYSIMYKTIIEQIKRLEQNPENEETHKKIHLYQKELEKIKKKGVQSLYMVKKQNVL